MGLTLFRSFTDSGLPVPQMRIDIPIRDDLPSRRWLYELLCTVRRCGRGSRNWASQATASEIVRRLQSASMRSLSSRAPTQRSSSDRFARPRTDETNQGGISALNRLGHTHYVPLGGQTELHLWGRGAIPAWVSAISLRDRFVFHGKRLFDERARTVGIDQIPTRVRDWTLDLSGLERAILEVL